jgi:O-antigen/teichoic acid export membrane protein
MTSVSILEVLTRAGQCGADKGMLRYIAAHRIAGERDLETRALVAGFRQGTIMSTILAISLALLAGTIARFQGKPELGGMLRLMAPAIVATATMMILVEAMLGAKAAHWNLLVRGLGEPISLLLAVLLAAACQTGINGLATAHLVAASFTCVLAFITAGKVFGGGRLIRSFGAPAHPEFARFTWPIAASEIMNAVQQRTSVILLGFFVGRVEVGIYAAVELVGRVIAGIRYAFDSIACPVISEALKLQDRERLRYNFTLMTRWVITIAAPIFITVISLRTDILAFFGPRFIAGSNLFFILASSHFINCALGLTQWVITMSGRSRLMFWNNFGAAMLNVVFNLLFIPRFNLPGAAWSALLSVMALQIAYIVEAWILERVHPFKQLLLKPVIAASGALLVQYVLTRFLPDGFYRMIPVIVAGWGVYYWLLVTLGLEPEDQRLLQRVRHRIKI